MRKAITFFRDFVLVDVLQFFLEVHTRKDSLRFEVKDYIFYGVHSHSGLII